MFTRSPPKQSIQPAVDGACGLTDALPSFTFLWTDGLDDAVTGLLSMPGMALLDTDVPCPPHEDWCRNDGADGVFAARQPDAGECTVVAFIDRLSGYPADALCCGTFWLREDFLTLDASLTDEQISLAMDVAQDSHDANTGYNWEYLRFAIESIKS